MDPSNDHLTAERLEELMVERLDRRELAADLLHLAVCNECRERFQALFPDQASACFLRWFGSSKLPNISLISKPDLEMAVRRGTARVHAVVREMEAAERLWLDIVDLHPKQRRLVVLNRRPFRTLGFAITVLQNAKKVWLDDPEEALERTDLALAILEQVEVQEGNSQRLNDFLGRSHACRANCHRILGSFGRAQRDFEKSRAYLQQGTGELTERALLAEYESTFLRDLRRLDEAQEMLEKASFLYEILKDMEGEVRVGLKRSSLMREAGESDLGVELLERLLSKHESRNLSSLTRFAIEQSLLVLLIDGDRLEEARQKLPNLRRLAVRIGQRFTTARLNWAEALLYDKTGEDEYAEERYQAVQQFFLDEGIGYDAAFVSLDLAAFYLDRGRYQEARDLATKLTPIFLSDDIHREAVASLLLFQEAVDRQEATAALARATAKALREVQGRPAHENGSVH